MSLIGQLSAPLICGTRKSTARRKETAVNATVLSCDVINVAVEELAAWRYVMDKANKPGSLHFALCAAHYAGLLEMLEIVTGETCAEIECEVDEAYNRLQ